MAVVEDFADAAACALGDFACALRGADADVLARNACAFADVFRGSDGMEGDEIAGAFADALGCLSGSLGRALADVAGSTADVTAGAAGLGLGLRLGGGLGLDRWVLGVLGVNVLGAECERYGEEREGWDGECVAHGWTLLIVRCESEGLVAWYRSAHLCSIVEGRAEDIRGGAL
jgi:hypothetical protein